MNSSRKLRIAFIYDAVYPWHIGGAEAIHHNEASELAKAHEVHFFSMRWPGMPARLKKGGITYHSVFRASHASLYRRGRRSISEALLFSAGLFELFKYRFDVVITNQFPVLHLPVVKLYCKLRGSRLVLHVDEVWDKAYWHSYLGKLPGSTAHALNSWLIRGADHYVSNSSTTASLLAKAGIPETKVSTFSPVINLREMSRFKHKGQVGNTVLFAGRLIKEKRLDLWLSVIKRINEISRMGVRGLIVGDGPEADRINDMVYAMGLADCVSMRGFYETRDQLYSCIRSAAAVLNMSEREGLSVVTLESLSLGTPVFLPTKTPIPKEIADMCNRGSVESISEGVSRLIAVGNKSEYIHRRKNLRQFLVSGTLRFYSGVFSKLGVTKGR